MARVKSVSSIDAEIAKTQEELAKLKERYDKTASMSYNHVVRMVLV